IVGELLDRKLAERGVALENRAILVDDHRAAAGLEDDGRAALAHHLVAARRDERTIRPHAKLAAARIYMRAVGALHFEEAFALNRGVELATRRLRLAILEVDAGGDFGKEGRHAAIVAEARARIGLDFARRLRGEIDGALAVTGGLARS